MKILVGILYCIENEFSACVESIEQQTYQNYDFFVIENLPKKEAHQKLYGKFSEGASTYDIFIKLDADMVLCRDTYFEEVVREFSADPDLTLLQVAVHDFFTDQLIFGLHNYRNTMKWGERNEVLFTDRQTTSTKTISDSEKLAPAAFHCPNPSEFQAFHFGVHKAVKVTQIGQKYKNMKSRNVHWSNIMRMRYQYQTKEDTRLGYAVLGSEMAFKYRFTHQQVDYGDAILNHHFTSVNNLTQDELAQTIERHTIFRYWPATFRFMGILLRIEHGSIFRASMATYYEVAKSVIKRFTREKSKVQ